MDKLVKNTDLAIAGILKEADSSNMRAVKQEVVLVEKNTGYLERRKLRKRLNRRICAK